MLEPTFILPEIFSGIYSWMSSIFLYLKAGSDNTGCDVRTCHNDSALKRGASISLSHSERYLQMLCPSMRCDELSLTRACCDGDVGDLR